MYSEVVWVLVSSGNQVQPQIILGPGYFPDYLSVSYDYAKNILDYSFPDGQFLIEGYSKPYRIDRNCGGVIVSYVRADIPSKLLPTELLPMEGFYVEINLQKKKWLLCCYYNPNKNAIKSHLEILNKGLASYSSKYENFIVLGDFNVGMKFTDMSVFCGTYDLKSFIKKSACYKNIENP